MTDELFALVNGQEIGRIRRDRRDRLTFAYADAWRRSRSAFPMSLSMPLAVREHAHAPIDAFFWGLLPDNDRVLDRWAKKFQVSARNAFALISQVGEDCAGAVQFVRPDRLDLLAGDAPGSVDWLDEAGVADRLRALREDQAAWRAPGDTGQFSLAGAQPKTALLLDSGRWGVPSGRTPTTHILKPPTGEFDGHAENEHFCLNLARALGIPAAASHVGRFMDEVAIVVERYDRAWDAGSVTRIHQEDICQALAISPTDKYENEGGPGVRQIADLLRTYSTAPEDDLATFVNALIFNWLIGGTDAHAKNYSVLIGAGGAARLAPLYDVASALVYDQLDYRKLKLAMKIGGEYRLRDIGPRQWAKLAAEVKLPSEQIIAQVDHLAAGVPDYAADVARKAKEEGLVHPVIDRLANVLTNRAKACRTMVKGGGDAGGNGDAASKDIQTPQYLPIQGTYFAHKLTLEGVGEEALTQSLTTARVDMNPHQVDAALFALSSPLSKGALLADEVGLGKTIEASLVIAQRWAERRRRILLIVPASLRKQWSQELLEKFSLPSIILESKTYNDAKKGGANWPFEQQDRIVILSYEFAALKASDIKHCRWDLVVFDEAHRLRNVYRKDGAKRARALRDATEGCFKILLTATPLQNSLMELYGLVSVIDDKFFGDENSFRQQYLGGTGGGNALLFLRKRLEMISKRTLRRQVQQAGLIRYTERYPLTIKFEPKDEEVTLYNNVSRYLQRGDTFAFGDTPNQLVTLVVRKILGSSTFAVAETLNKIIERLKRRLPPTSETVSDYDAVDNLAEEYATDETEQDSAPVDAEKLAAEIAELEEYRALALKIGSNAKGLELVKALPKALDEIASKGGNRKAVIFTESVRTQTYLAELLAANGYDGQVVRLNGQNNDSDSRAIYEDWKARHAGSDAISGSRSADMKAAIVEAFRDRRSILIATESGAEGINLQFCSLVVNFDLPWNPQRVEQRIGRCHRYGQKIDVAVVNFLNLKNHAEQRVFELLDSKFNLFKGVFGASDEVLGAIEGGVDIEKRILAIVQNSRDEAEINRAFDQLQLDLQEKIDAEILDARKRLLENVDERVIQNLKARQNEIQQHISEFDQRLLLLARAELPEARFHADHRRRFDYRGITYTTEWPLADERGWQFFRLQEGSLAIDLVERAKARRHEQPANLRFVLSAYAGGKLADVERLRGFSGWARIAKLKIETRSVNREHLIVAVKPTVDTTEIHPDTLERLLQVPALDLGTPAEPVPEPALAALEQIRFGQLMDEAEHENADWLDEESAKLDSYADDLERSFDAEIKALEADIKQSKKAVRGANLSLEEKLAEKRRIAGVEAQRDKMKAEFFDRRSRIRAEVEEMLDRIQENLKMKPVLTPLIAFRWEVQ